MLAQPPQFDLPMDWSTHICDIDTEPLHRYHRGGYHPVHLGDCLSNGRYKVLHKLGWGGYSTVWAARDTRSRFLQQTDTIRADMIRAIKPTLL
jgi:serine/threonine-protein kinase SRPK3